MNPDPSELQVHHVGIVARDEAQIQTFRDALGLVEEARERIDRHNVTNVFLRGAGAARIHFMLQDHGVLRNFNQGRGGLHHVAFAVRDIELAQAQLEARGLHFISPTPQQGIGSYRFNFAFPNVAGINVELIHDPSLDWPSAASRDGG